MIKKLMSAASAVVVTLGLVGVMQAPDTNATDETAPDPKVTICHRTNSAKNPYVSLSLPVTAIDGTAGNSGSEPDHYGEHKGPLASSEEVATQLKNDKTEWGDIIPPVPGKHAGQNYSAEGQAILANGCNYVTPVQTTPNTAVTAVCVPTEQLVRLTFVNSGTAESTISMNGGAATKVAAGATVTLTTPITGAKVNVNVVIDGKAQVVKVECPSGGSGTVTTSGGQGQTAISSTPAAPAPAASGRGSVVASLPVTSGSSSQIIALTVLLGSALAGAATYVVRARSGISL